MCRRLRASLCCAPRGKGMTIVARQPRQHAVIAWPVEWEVPSLRPACSPHCVVYTNVACQNVLCCASVCFGSFNFFVFQHVFWFVVSVCLGSFNFFVLQHVFSVFCEHMSVQSVPREGPESLLEKVGAD